MRELQVDEQLNVMMQNQGNNYFEAFKQTQKSGIVPKWLEFNAEKLEGKVIALPQREDIDSQIQEHMIVELYSK